MSFHKKSQFQKDTTISNEVPNTETQEELIIYLRKYFTLVKNIFKPSLIERYSQKILQTSLLKFYLLGRIFFKPLCDRFKLKNIQAKKLIKNKEMQKFIQITLCKLRLFQSLIISEIENLMDQRVEKFSSYLVLDQKKRFDSIKQQIIITIKYQLFGNVLKFLEIYCKVTKKNEQLRVSMSHPYYYATPQDQNLACFISDSLKNIRLNNVPKERIQKFTRIQKLKNRLKPSHSYHEFTQKIFYHCTFADEAITDYLVSLTTNVGHQRFSATIENINTVQKASNNKNIYDFQTISNVSTDISEKQYFKAKAKKAEQAKEKNSNNKNFLASRKRQVQTKFLKNISIQRPIYPKCLNCVQYFYVGLPVQSQRIQLVKYQILNSINMIKQNPDIIRELIGGMLNKGGGTIFFGSKKTNFGFIPIGQYVKLKEQQSFKASFQNLFKCITPQSYQKLIDFKIDFIPLKQSPLDSDGKIIINHFSFEIQRLFIPQLYVMRVKLSPRNKKQLFGCQIDKMNYFFTRQDGRSLIFKDEALYKEIKRRIFKFTQFTKKEDILKLNKIQQQLGKQFFFKVIRGKRCVIQNTHEGKCFETLTLSVASLKAY